LNPTGPDAPATVLVVGTGYVGRRFLDRQAAGRAIGLSRTVIESRQPVHGLDLDSDETLTTALPQSYSVLYTAPPSPVHDTDRRLERLLALLDPAPRRFVYISTTGVYGDCGGEPVSEERPVNPQSGRARLRVAAEQAVSAWCDARGVSLVILRVPGIYGPGRLGVERIRTGAANIRDSEANPGNRIHVDDLVRCCEAAIDDTAVAGIVNVGDGDHRSATWFAGEVARQCGLEPPPVISRKQAEREFSPMRLSFLGESRRIDTTKMREALGVTPLYEDAAAGIAASLRQ
jgi:nucleoside-diphosphate-sugar epimerase